MNVFSLAYFAATVAGMAVADAARAQPTVGNPLNPATARSVAVDAAGTVFVADTYNHRIRTISPAGVVSVLAGSTKGYSEGTVYVADTGNERIRKISPAGVVTTLASGKQGFADGIGPAATFHSPYAVKVDVDGAVYVADAGNNRICRIAPDGAVVTLVGSLKGLDHPTGLAVDAAGAVYVADSGNNRICKVTAAGSVSTRAGSMSGFADEPGEAARFNHPVSVAVDDAGTVYVGEQGNNRVRVISPAGVVSTVAGSGIATLADGTGPQASLSLPVGIALDANGTLYVADMGNNSIRKVVLR